MAWQDFVRSYGITAPFVGAGMGMIARPELAAAVSNAGGLGQLSGSSLPPDVLAHEIDRLRTLTSKPFGVNFIVETVAFGDMTTDALVATCAERRVPVVVFHWNPPKPGWIAALKAAGVRIWATVNSEDEAHRARELGLDAAIAQGVEAGGHVRATQGVFDLIPVVSSILPTIAAGGVGNAETAARAIRLGADAVCIGTRLVASQESPAHPQYKARLVAAGADDTHVTRVFGPEWPDAPVRALRTRASQGLDTSDAPVGRTTVFGRDYEMPPYSAILPTVETEGDVERMCLLAGTTVADVRAVVPVAEIVAEVVSKIMQPQQAA